MSGGPVYESAKPGSARTNPTPPPSPSLPAHGPRPYPPPRPPWPLAPRPMSGGPRTLGTGSRDGGAGEGELKSKTPFRVAAGGQEGRTGLWVTCSRKGDSDRERLAYLIMRRLPRIPSTSPPHRQNSKQASDAHQLGRFASITRHLFMVGMSVPTLLNRECV